MLFLSPLKYSLTKNNIKAHSDYIYGYMKLLKTIKKIIQEAEEQYNHASETNTPLEELDRLEKHYKDSLKLLKLYNSKQKNKSENSK
jgi:lipoate synthase